MDENSEGIPARGASWANLVLAIWLIIAPWTVGYSMDVPAVWNSTFVGICILLVALVAAGSRSPGPSWANLAFGVWLVLSPLLLGIASRSALWNFVIVGILVAVDALLSIRAKRRPAPSGDAGLSGAPW